MASKKRLKKQIKRQAQTIAELWAEKLNATSIPLNPVDGVTISAIAIVSGQICHLSFRYKLTKDETTGQWINAEPARVCVDGLDAGWSNLAIWNHYMTDEEIQKQVDAFVRSMKIE